MQCSYLNHTVFVFVQAVRSRKSTFTDIRFHPQLLLLLRLWQEVALKISHHTPHISAFRIKVPQTLLRWIRLWWDSNQSDQKLLRTWSGDLAYRSSEDDWVECRFWWFSFSRRDTEAFKEMTDCSDIFSISSTRVDTKAGVSFFWLDLWHGSEMWATSLRFHYRVLLCTRAWKGNPHSTALNGPPQSLLELWGAVRSCVCYRNGSFEMFRICWDIQS